MITIKKWNPKSRLIEPHHHHHHRDAVKEDESDYKRKMRCIKKRAKSIYFLIPCLHCLSMQKDWLDFSSMNTLEREQETCLLIPVQETRDNRLNRLKLKPLFSAKTRDTLIIVFARKFACGKHFTKWTRKNTRKNPKKNSLFLNPLKTGLLF